MKSWTHQSHKFLGNHTSVGHHRQQQKQQYYLMVVVLSIQYERGRFKMAGTTNKAQINETGINNFFYKISFKNFLINRKRFSCLH